MEQESVQKLYDDYVKRFFDFDLAVSRTQLVALCATHVFHDFPSFLPERSKKEIEATIERAINSLFEGLAKLTAKKGGGAKADAEEGHVEDEKALPYAAPLVSLFFTGNFSSDPGSRFNFDHVLNAQQLVMLLAHLDAFLADSLRVVCRREPRLLRLQKTVTWQTVLDCGSYDGLIDRLIEEYSYEVGWKSLGAKVAFMSRNLGLAFQTKAEDINQLELAENLRHIIIHNGGRASLQYIDKTKRQDVRVGELLPISSEYVNDVGEKGRGLAMDVYSRIAVKFFGVSEDSVFTPRLPVTDSDS